MKFDKVSIPLIIYIRFVIVFFLHMFIWELNLKALPLDQCTFDSLVDKKYLGSAESLSIRAKASELEGMQFSAREVFPLLSSLNSWENFTKLINFERKTKSQWYYQKNRDNFFLKQMGSYEFPAQEVEQQHPAESIIMHEGGELNKDEGGGIGLDFIFIIAFVVVPILIYLLMKKSNISVNSITILNFLILSIFFFDYIGLLPLYFGWDQYRYNIGIQDKAILCQIFIYTSWSMFSLIFSYVCLKHYIGNIPYNFGSYRYRAFTKLEEILVYALLLISLIFLFLYIQKVPKIALWEALTKGARMGALARSKMGNDFAGKYHWYSLMIHDFLNLIVFALFANWLLVKRWATGLVLLIAFLFATYTSIMGLEKCKLLLLLTGLFVVYSMLKNEGKIFTKTALKLFFFLLLFSVLFYMYFMGFKRIGVIFVVLSRAFGGQIQPAYHYLEFFPTHHDFLWGQSFPNPGGIFPFKPYLIPIEITKWKFPEVSQTGIVGSSPTIFWGELYGNFGILGVLIGPFFVGAGLYVVELFVNNLKNTSLKCGFYAWLVLHYMELAHTGVSKFIVDLYACGTLFFVLIVILISNIYTYIKQNLQLVA